MLVLLLHTSESGGPGSQTVGIQAVLQATFASSLTAAAVLRQEVSQVTGITAVLQLTDTQAVSSSAVLQQVQLRTLTGTAVVQQAGSASVTAQAVLQNSSLWTIGTAALLTLSGTHTVGASGHLQATGSAAVTAQAILQRSSAVPVDATALLVLSSSHTVGTSGQLQFTGTPTIVSTGVLQSELTQVVGATGALWGTQGRSVATNALLSPGNIVGSLSCGISARLHAPIMGISLVLASPRLIVAWSLRRGGQMVTQIPPRTTADLIITVTDAITGAALDDATVVVSVYDPKGLVVADEITVLSDGAGLATYTLLWEAGWTTQNTSRPKEGEYRVDVLTTRAGRQSSDRFVIPVRYPDDDE